MESQSGDQEYFVQFNDFSCLARPHLHVTRVQDPKAVPHLGKLGGTFISISLRPLLSDIT